MRHAAGRPGRDRDPRRSQAAGQARHRAPAEVQHAAAQPRLRRAGPEGPRGRRRRAGPRRAGRRLDRRLPPRRDGTPGPRPRALPAAQPAPGLRAPHRLGPARPAGAGGRARHQLPRAHRHPRRHRPRGPAADDAAELRRRLCRRLAVHGRRPARRHPGSAPLGPGPGGRCRHRRRRHAPGQHLLRHARRRPLAARPRHQRERRRVALLRLLRMRRRPLDRRGADRSEVLRRAAAAPGHRRREPRAAAVARALEGRQGTCSPRASRRAAATNGRALLQHTDACASPVLTFAEAPQHPHLRARGTFVEIDGIVQAAPAPRFSRTVPPTPTPPRATTPENTERSARRMVRGRQDRRRCAARPSSTSTDHGPSLHRRGDRLSRRGARFLRTSPAARHPAQVRARPAHLEARDAALGAHPARARAGPRRRGRPSGAAPAGARSSSTSSRKSCTWPRRRSRSRST